MDNVWQLAKAQTTFGTNTRVQEIEKRFGAFAFNERIVDDGIAKILVGPQPLENGATYYGQW